MELGLVYCFLPSRLLRSFRVPKALHLHNFLYFVSCRPPANPSKLLAGYLLEALTFMSPLIMSFAYMYSVDAPDATVGLIIFRIKARYLPWAMLGMSFLLNGPIAVMYEATGLVAGHLYHFLTYIWPTHGGGTNYITVPPLIRRWFPQPRGTTRAYGTAFQRQDPPAGSSTTIRPNAAAGSGLSWASGFTSGSWGSRGPGRRLGGD